MKIICSRSALAEGLNIASKAVGSKASMAILECCLLTADGAGFRVTANDTEMAIETKPIEADILEEGAVALDSKVFFDIVRRLPGASVEITVDEKNVTIISSDKARFKILGYPAAEFPGLPEVDENAAGYTMPSNEFKNMIRQTIFSVSQDPSKPVLCGELLEITGGMARIVSVDGFRISLRKYTIGDGPNMKVVIPGKTLNEISKILPSDADAEIRFYTTDRHIVFDMENALVVSRLVEGEFINFENMMVKEGDTTITVGRAKLLDSIERAALISRDAKKSPVKLKIEDGQIFITSNTEMGTSYEEVTANQDGANLEIAFNPRYITEILKVLECEFVTMKFNTPLSPCIIRVEGDDSYEYLVLPLRLRN